MPNFNPANMQILFLYMVIVLVIHVVGLKIDNFLSEFLVIYFKGHVPSNPSLLFGTLVCSHLSRKYYRIYPNLQNPSHRIFGPTFQRLRETCTTTVRSTGNRATEGIVNIEENVQF